MIESTLKIKNKNKNRKLKRLSGDKTQFMTILPYLFAYKIHVLVLKIRFLITVVPWIFREMTHFRNRQKMKWKLDI